MTRWLKRLTVLGGLAIMALLNSSCSKQDIQVKQEPGPLIIHMYGSLDDAYQPFLNTLAEQFPDIEFRYEFQWDQAGIYETERRMLNEDGPDMAIVNGAALESLAEKELLLDLTGEPFSMRYHVSIISSLNGEGRVHGLPLPNDLNCLVGNRALLNQYGIHDFPQTISELIDVCHVLTDNGQGAIIADGALYRMLLHTAYLCRPEGYDWLSAYNNGIGSMSETPAVDAWKSFQDIAEVSGCSTEQASDMPAARTNMLITGDFAFRVTNISNLKYMERNNPDLDLVALPMLGNTPEDQWVFYASNRTVRCFVANKNLEQPEHEVKKKVVLDILNWISTNEAQRLLASCGGSSISYVKDVELDQGDIMTYLNPVIDEGHVTGLLDWKRGMEDVVNNCAVQITGNNMTAQEAVIACDNQNKEYVPPQERQGLDEVIGTASNHIYWRKPAAVTVGSPMTQLTAMAMAHSFPEADFAFSMAKNAASTLYKGDITMGDALFCAEGEGDRELVLVQATGEQIKKLIGAGVGSSIPATFTSPYGIAGAGRLLHPVGLTYQADVTREKGDQVTEIIINGGGTLENDRTYTIIVSGLLIDGVAEPNLSGCYAVPTGKHLRDVLVEYIRENGEVTSPEIGFSIKGYQPLYTFP